jgi:hypothetical protein
VGTDKVQGLRENRSAASKLSDLTPRESHRIIDLVRAAGVDVSDWANFKGGEKKAATNPKYCYEWSFMEPNKVVVLNLWSANLKEQNGHVEYALNMRDVVHRAAQLPKRAAQQKRKPVEYCGPLFQYALCASACQIGFPFSRAGAESSHTLLQEQPLNNRHPKHITYPSKSGLRSNGFRISQLETF